MRPLRITALAFTMTLAVAFAGRADGAAPAGEPADGRDLARENERLRAENRDLRERLRRLEEGRHPPLPMPRPPATRPQPPQRSRGVPLPPGNGGRIPENWVPREINGLRFYIIPLTPRWV
jgi:hypothetical protein